MEIFDQAAIALMAIRDFPSTSRIPAMKGSIGVPLAPFLR
jgi:hypothetical protein